jgi:hypothetical protein
MNFYEEVKKIDSFPCRYAAQDYVEKIKTLGGPPTSSGPRPPTGLTWDDVRSLEGFVKCKFALPVPDRCCPFV